MREPLHRHGRERGRRRQGLRRDETDVALAARVAHHADHVGLRGRVVHDEVAPEESRRGRHGCGVAQAGVVAVLKREREEVRRVGRGHGRKLDQERQRVEASRVDDLAVGACGPRGVGERLRHLRVVQIVSHDAVSSLGLVATKP